MEDIDWTFLRSTGLTSHHEHNPDLSMAGFSRVCGHRVVVELSNGRKRNRPGGMPMGGGRDMMGRGPPPPRRPRFDPNDRCYECGERGHYAYNCHRRRSGRGRWVLCRRCGASAVTITRDCRSD